MGKLSRSSGNLGESFSVDSGKLKTRVAKDLLLEEFKRFNTVLKPKVDHLENMLARLVAMHAACSNWKNSRTEYRIGKSFRRTQNDDFLWCTSKLCFYKTTSEFSQQRGDA